MKDLIEQVAAGYSYNPVSWQDVAAYSLNQQSGPVSTHAACPAQCLWVTVGLHPLEVS